MFTERLIPECYCFDSSLIEILLERHNNFDIFWYHWPRDGVCFWIEDYEPITLIYNNNIVCCVVVRNNWRYTSTSNTNNQLSYPIRIFFDPFHHHPSLITYTLTHTALRILRPLIREQRLIDKNEIPLMFRIGRGHPTYFGSNDFEDPIDYATKLHKDFCNNFT